jgi:signal transduction histidine kinase
MYLERVKINQQTLLRLIDDVLDLAKLESGRVEYELAAFRIDDLLRTLEAFIAPTLQQKGIAYHFEACGSGIQAYADRDKTEQVLLNLLSNALKFTDAGRIEVRCVHRDDRLEIQVIDTGQGVRPELLGKIFEPFVQGDPALTRAAKGTGLGLSISRQLARGMSGDLLAVSEQGKGSTFTLVLPAVNGRSPKS